MTLTIEEFEDILVGYYPTKNLRLTGFLYHKADQGRRLREINFTNLSELKGILKQGKLFLVPKRDIPVEEAEEIALNPPATPLHAPVIDQRTSTNEPPSTAETPNAQAQATADEPANTAETTNAPAQATAEESPIEFMNPPTRELDEDQSVQPDPEDSQESLPVIRRRRLRLRRAPIDASYTDANTPGEVSIRRSSALRARDNIRHNARVILAGEETPSSGTDTPERSPLLLDISNDSSISTLQAALDRLDAVFSDTQQVTIRRDHVFEDLMKLYDNPTILQHRLGVTFAGESGEDAGGLTKDLFATFWERACTRFFTGEDAVVPHLPPHRFAEAASTFPVLGRILCHSLALTRSLPIQICRTVLIQAALGQIVKSKTLLIEDFLLFMSEHERTLTRKGLDSFQTLTTDERSQLTDMFARFSMSVIPSAENFRQHIENLASCELTGKPLFLCQLMGSGIPEIYKDVFFHHVTQEDLVSLCERLKPTPSRVISLLKTEHDLLRPEQDRVLYFLKDFVRTLSSEDLTRFLQFVTGSCVMPTSGGITVCFHHAQGLLRYPIGRTCGNVLSLPVEYDTLQDFKREFIRIIRNDESFRMYVT
ncbi:ubiquitin-protein ligase E3A-like [Argopecten irradians]|uniref:ubiquitin-protein ligase E3A-like n=1 Tax=Argopecten irradians TaxID=31199 RepID=UPI00371B3266